MNDFTRAALAIEVGWPLKAENVVEVPDLLVRHRGAPHNPLCGQRQRTEGPAERCVFTGRMIYRRADCHQVSIDFLAPGSPWQNGHVVSFSGTFRDECLNTHCFRTPAEAGRLIETQQKG